MRAETYIQIDGRRAELGDFLRRRRAELNTDSVGLPATRRRRTPGLRREEVAELANISAALYAWLEQGRDIPISRRTIEAIATALQLDASEREHVLTLITPQTGEFQEEVSPQLERMVGALRTQPAFIVDHRWDVVLVNRCAHLIFKHENDEALPHLNILASTFGPHGRALFANWRDVARMLVELFHYDYASYATDADTLALVETLRTCDPDFADVWAAHRVRRSLGPGSVCRINTAFANEIVLEMSMFAVVESPGLRCLIFTPVDEESAQRIDRVVTSACADLDNHAAGATMRLR